MWGFVTYGIPYWHANYCGATSAPTESPMPVIISLHSGALYCELELETEPEHELARAPPALSTRELEARASAGARALTCSWLEAHARAPADRKHLVRDTGCSRPSRVVQAQSGDVRCVAGDQC